ncbi:MAG: SLBB domain-containing protein [Chlorobiota bacterium]|nr:SLBB domain-containing protein [Chlorobiota bacterium]QQS66098.1 MAG: SLBB domain-containing protein [Chlorobiota bacterium]
MINYFSKYSLLFILVLNIGLAQDSGVKQLGGASNESIFTSSKSQTSNPFKDISSSLINPIERVIDPEEYMLGPNDQLILSIPVLDDANVPLIVSSDNSIVLPRGFGIISLKGKSLKALRKTVDSLFVLRSKAYSNISVSLLKPRSIYVTVTGFVRNPGRFVMTATDRVTTAIAFANQIQKEDKAKSIPIIEQDKYSLQDKYETNQNLDFYINEIAPRKIIIRRNDGTIETADLAKYKAYGNTINNPLLREGDEIIIAKVDQSKPVISISGAVNNNVLIPYSKGDNADLMLRLSGGFRDDADLSKSTISKVSEIGISSNHIDLNYQDSNYTIIPLTGGEQIVVPSTLNSNSKNTGVVNIYGEVNKPSTYSIIDKGTKLSQLIKEAEGFTLSASLEGSYIIREKNKFGFDADRTSDSKVSELSNSNLKFEDSTRFKYDRKLQRNRVSVDFIDLFINNNLNKDVILFSGDEIFIPANPKNVYVRGRVIRPGWVQFKEGADYQYYINAAGGLTVASEIGRTIIQKYGTGAWESFEKSKINPGDEVYVPGESDIPARTAFEQISTTVGFISGIAGIIGSIVNIYIALKK